VVTPTREVDAELDRWRERRAARREALREALAAEKMTRPPRRWWQRRR
jgi:hypothetical protein